MDAHINFDSQKVVYRRLFFDVQGNEIDDDNIDDIWDINERELSENYDSFSWSGFTCYGTCWIATHPYIDGYIDEDNKTSGTIGYIVASSKEVTYWDTDAIVSFAVTKEFRNHGIGYKLVQCLLDNYPCSADSLPDIKLTWPLQLIVRTSNYQAQRLYRKFGFKIIRTVKDYYQNDPVEDGYVMELTFFQKVMSKNIQDSIQKMK